MNRSFVLCILCTFSSCYPTTTVRRLIQTLLSLDTPLTRTERVLTQLKLIRALKRSRLRRFADEPTLLFLATQALARDTLLKHFKCYAPALLRSFSLFQHTPGYLETLHRILCHADQRNMVIGHGYECERAIALQMAPTSEQITSFNQQLDNGTITRRIDLITSERLIECKNCCFAPRYIPTLKRQFSQQAELIQEVYGTSLYPIPFEIHSKRRMPSDLATWCTQRGIRVVIEKKP